MFTQLRIARPVTDVAASAQQYVRGLKLEVLGSFSDHDGFDGIMVGRRGERWHLEFTRCSSHSVAPAPTPEDLLVLYIPDETVWTACCEDVLEAGFKESQPFNPYWKERGRLFQDRDGYNIVLQNAAWG